MRKIYDEDPWLLPYKEAIDARHRAILAVRDRYAPDGRLSEAFNNHLYFGLHREPDGSWVFREWAPNAVRIHLIGDCNNWKRTKAYELSPLGGGTWELRLDGMFLSHGELYKLFIEWPGGGGERLPSYATRCVQDPVTKVFCAQVWDPDQPYVWKYPRPARRPHPLIYECHIGMASEEGKVASFDEFRRNVLPRVAALGYDVIQIMALQEHPYYGSFGYQVSNFFALSSRFGTPEEFKALVDEAHRRHIAVVMDIVHSHSVDNEAEGLSCFDGREDLYFGLHREPDGSWVFREWAFDGVTSMLYWDHGLGRDFNGYDNYFNEGVDTNALVYLALANLLVREIHPGAITIAEDVSGMPGLAAPFIKGGIGFGFRMAMGIADHWIKWIKEKTDEQWSMGEIWHELTNKRADEKTISYAECHDQALVGDKTIIFRLMDKEMYTAMNIGSENLTVDRGIALHKMIRLVTLATSGGGYLTFMGNEFGHPEWIDFPREGNQWSFHYARRQWSLEDSDSLRYGQLRNFDEDMVHLFKKQALLDDSPQLIKADEGDHVLIFRRKNCIFAFNFHPVESYTGYGVAVPDGLYISVLDSDDSRYGGFGRLQRGEIHWTQDGQLKVYLPARTALVLMKKVD